MKYSSSSVAISWLCLLLKERFGHDFKLLPQVNNTLKIVLDFNSNYIEITQDAEEFSRSDSSLACVKWNAEAEGWQTTLDPFLPMPGSGTLKLPLIASTENGYFISYDILGLVYWMLSRQEEVNRTDLDGHGRFPAIASHAYKHGYLERPIVDEWLHILGQVIERTWPGIELKKHSFSIKVSHDVDEPSRYGFRRFPALARAMAGDIINKHDFKSPILASWIRLNTRSKLSSLDPYNTFDWIMDVSEKHGLISAFYFICGRSMANFDADYELDHPAIRSLMLRIHNRGHEIGLHPSYATYRQPALLKAEADRLRKIAGEEGIKQSEWGGRMHYLRWENPTTMRAWSNAGMSYDSTLSYADRPGFRCGTCIEYPAFDPVAGEILPFRIRPLIAMECSVIADSYLSLGLGSAALDKFMHLKNSCRAVGGCFTLLWHNSQFESNESKEIYKEILC
jgi:hypothetical protein